MIDHLAKLAVHCYYAGELDAGRRAIDKALRSPDIAEDVENQIRGNRVWYTQPLGDLLDVDLRRIDVVPARERWTTFNPALAGDGETMLAIVRSSNYHLTNGRYEIPPEDGDRIRTENILCRLSWSGDVLESKPLMVAPYATNDYPVAGLEDCRLQRVGSDWWVSATARDVERFDGRCRIVTGRLDVESGRVGQIISLDGLSLHHHEKNWMPIEGTGSWIHSCHHEGHVVTVDPDPTMPMGWTMARRSKSPPVARRFRGGSQLVRVGDRGFLAIVHEVALFGNHRAYEHRFVLFADDLSIIAVTPAFALKETRCVEFAAGLAVHDERVVVSFGFKDAEAWLASMDAEALCGLMTPAW